MLKQGFRHHEIRDLAVLGKELSDKLRSQTEKHNRAADKMKDMVEAEKWKILIFRTES